MSQIADILLIGGALGLAFYCYVLSRRLTRFTDLERGVGGAVAVLSGQVDDLMRALDRATEAASGSNATLGDLTERAETVARNLELQLAALHDIEARSPAPDAAPASPPPPAPTPSFGGARLHPAPPADAREPEPKPEPEAPAAAVVSMPPTQSFFAHRRAGQVT